MSRLLLKLAVTASCLTGGTLAIMADEKAPVKSEAKPVPLTRLFVQDHKASTLRWADVTISDQDELNMGTLAEIDGFKKLNPEKQKLVQMKEQNRLICVGVRDEEDGAFESGWVLVRSGVSYTEHGDHGHWSFKKKPDVLDYRLDKKQGNPAHLYLYDGRFFLANDKLNGYTRVDPAKYEFDDKDQPQFFTGGGNHITLATVENRVGYSAWIDGGGPNKGRVDVTPLTSKTKFDPAYSFHLPTGVIHGATANSGKVFFAPADGICWVQADLDCKLSASDVKVNHISLGSENEKPRRTGAFTNYKHYVVFTAGKESNSSLVLLNAKDSEPKPMEVKLNVKPGTQPVTPEIATTRDGQAYAFIFHDHPVDVEAQDLLEIIQLDPNRDGDCSDAKIVKTLKVGKSGVSGHFGHHQITFDADRRYGFFNNPGDATISVLSLKTLEVVKTFPVGGNPTAVLAVGTRDVGH